MSFILSFIRAPGLLTVQTAADYVSNPPVPAPESTRHFAAFVERISEYFPDLCEDENALDRNLWPEGLDRDELNGPVVNVQVNSDMLDPGVMSVIATQACLSGLQVLDEQNGVLYGPGLLSVDMSGGMSKRLPEVTPHARSLMTENIRGMGLLDSQRLIAEGLAGVLGAGFAVVGGGGETVLRRVHGQLHQIIALRVLRSVEKPGMARLYVRLGFASDELAATWLRLLPADFGPRKQRYDTSEGGVSMQLASFLPNLHDFDPAASLTLGSRSEMGFADPVARQQLIEAARPWSQAKLLPYLERIVSVSDLQRLFIHAQGLQHFGRASLSFPAYPTVLTLAQRAGPETLAAYAAACRANPDLARLCSLFKDPKGAHIDQLIAGLQALPRP